MMYARWTKIRIEIKTALGNFQIVAVGFVSACISNAKNSYWVQVQSKQATMNRWKNVMNFI
jgi:hypothetical protein